LQTIPKLLKMFIPQVSEEGVRNAAGQQVGKHPAAGLLLLLL
jgi:hypothetical protein